jgi:hypothetical protein
VDAAIAGAAPNLVPGTVVGGHAVLASGTVRALKALAPLKIAPDTSHLEIRLDQAELAATPQIAALEAAVATKQNALAAGSSLVFHEKLLEGAKVKSLAPGEGVGLSSTGDLVTISASGVNSAVSSALAGKQGVLTQPGLFGTELLYDSSKLKRLAFGSGLTGGTEEQPDGSQTISMSVKSNLPVSTLTPPRRRRSPSPAGCRCPV